MKPLLHCCLLLAAAWTMPRCKKIDETPPSGPGTLTGNISGRVMAANNRTPISRALVFVDDKGQLSFTYTGTDGSFTLEAPAGSQQLHIQTGDGAMFHTEMQVTVTPGQTTVLPAAGVKLEQVAKLAYVTGNYDKIEQLLIDSLGYTARQLHFTSLGIIDSIRPYDALYLNCAESFMQPYSPLNDQALATYVTNGGSMYVSDWAVRHLVGEHISASCPAVRPGGFIPDSLLCIRKNGMQITLVNSPVLSASLSAYLNKPAINIFYDLGAWEKVVSANTNFWEVMVADVTGNPLLLRTHQYAYPGAPAVQVGSGNNNRVTICHKVSGGNPVTITIPAAALPAHLAHGDTIGECGNTDGSGRIYFTTFHNEPNGVISPDVQQILQYMILNL